MVSRVNQEILSRPQIWNRRQLSSHVPGGLEGRSIPLHNVWKGVRSIFCRPTQIDLKQSDFMAHGTSDRCPDCRALISGGRAQGHTEECRIRVEGDIRKTGEESPSSCRSQSSWRRSHWPCVEESSICSCQYHQVFLPKLHRPTLYQHLDRQRLQLIRLID